MKESDFRQKICRDLKAYGVIVMPIVGSAAGGSGWPDTYISSNHISFFIEFKGEKTEIEPMQTTVMNKLREKGDVVYVLRCPGILQEPTGAPICEIKTGFELLKYMRENHRERLKR